MPLILNRASRSKLIPDTERHSKKVPGKTAEDPSAKGSYAGGLVMDRSGLELSFAHWLAV
jgi:hypothetical protein